MAKKIEIFENTLLKLLVRRGPNVDRQNVVLSEGELGYTTDTKKLFIGDGSTAGGILVGGSKFVGAATNVTTFVNVESGDFAYDTDNLNFYSFIGGDTSNINNWRKIGGVYSAGNTTLSTNSTNQFFVGTLSAGNFSNNALGQSLTLDNTLKITLSSTIKVDKISTQNNTALEIPSTIKVGPAYYTLPTGGYGTNRYLKTDILGNLSWDYAADNTTMYFPGTAGQIPVGTILPFVSAGINAPSGWLLCNGQPVLSTAYTDLYNVIGTTYGTGSVNEFLVPNLTNVSVYGTNTAPSTSTTFSIASGNNSSLSAKGALFIIKAVSDGVINTSMTVNSPITATVNNVLKVGAFNPLSGNVQLGLARIRSASESVYGGFVTDEYGRVTSSISVSAGTKATILPGSGEAYNVGSSSISFFTQPVSIVPLTPGFTGQNFTISAFPYITNYQGVASTFSVPPNAKNLIVDSWISKSDPNGGNVNRIIASAPNASLLTTVGTQYIGSSEFFVNASAAAGKGDYIAGATQVIVPLSAANNGALICAFRINSSSGDNLALRVVGYTL